MLCNDTSDNGDSWDSMMVADALAPIGRQGISNHDVVKRWLASRQNH